MGEPQDEISLRELYLIFKGGLRWVLTVSVVVALATFAVMLLLPKRYKASATVRLSPIQVQGQTLQNGQIQQDLIDVNSVAQMGFDGFRTIALSHAVLSSAVKATPALSADFGTKQLAQVVNVVKVSGGGTDPLMVSLDVTTADPRQAAALANAWAKASAAATRTTIGNALSGVRNTMDSQLSSLTAALNQAEAAWASFQKQDERSSLQAQLDGLDTRTTTAQATLDILDRNIATARAQQGVLRAVIAARSQGTPADLSAQMQALSNNGVLSASLAQELTDALASVPNVPGTSNQDLATLVARAQLQQRTADLAGYVAERSTVSEQLDSFAKKASDLRDQLAAQQQTAQDLQRKVTGAQGAYDQVSRTAPLIDVADKLVPSMAGVFDPASVPERPARRHTIVATVVAFILAFFAMALFVFVRAAVSETASGGRPDGMAGSAAHRPGVDRLGSGRRSSEPTSGSGSLSSDAGPGDH